MKSQAEPPAIARNTTAPRTRGIRAAELGPTLRRDLLLQRVRAARKRLPQAPAGGLARVR